MRKKAFNFTSWDGSEEDDFRDNSTHLPTRRRGVFTEAPMLKADRERESVQENKIKELVKENVMLTREVERLKEDLLNAREEEEKHKSDLLAAMTEKHERRVRLIKEEFDFRLSEEKERSAKTAAQAEKAAELGAEKVAGLEARIQELQIAAHVATEARKNEERRVEQLNSQTVTLQEQVAAALNTVAQFSEKHVTLQREAEVLQETINKREDVIKKQKTKISSLEQQIEAFQRDLEAAHAEFSTLAKHAERQNKMLSDVQHGLEDQKMQRAQLDRTIALQETQLRDEERRSQCLAEEIKSYKVQVDALQADNKTLVVQTNQFKDVAKSSWDEAQSLRKETELLRQRLQQQEEATRQLKHLAMHNSFSSVPKKSTETMSTGIQQFSVLPPLSAAAFKAPFSHHTSTEPGQYSFTTDEPQKSCLSETAFPLRSATENLQEEQHFATEMIPGITSHTVEKASAIMCEPGMSTSTQQKATQMKAKTDKCRNNSGSPPFIADYPPLPPHVLTWLKTKKQSAKSNCSSAPSLASKEETQTKPPHDYLQEPTLAATGSSCSPQSPEDDKAAVKVPPSHLQWTRKTSLSNGDMSHRLPAKFKYLDNRHVQASSKKKPEDLMLSVSEQRKHNEVDNPRASERLRTLSTCSATDQDEVPSKRSVEARQNVSYGGPLPYSNSVRSSCSSRSSSIESKRSASGSFQAQYNFSSLSSSTRRSLSLSSPKHRLNSNTSCCSISSGYNSEHSQFSSKSNHSGSYASHRSLEKARSVARLVKVQSSDGHCRYELQTTTTV